MTIGKLEKPQSLDEQAYQSIKDAILKCVFRPGEFLPEVRLAEELGISKTPVRNAMARLNQEGFVDTVPYKGHFVSEISGNNVTEIYELRQVLECYVIRQTTHQFTQVELDAMENNVKLADIALGSGDLDRYVMLNRGFHHTFDQKYGSQSITDVLSNLDEHVQRIIFFTLQNDDYQDILDMQRGDHLRIFKAIQSGDAETAVSMMENHLSQFCTRLVNRMRETASTHQTNQ